MTRHQHATVRSVVRRLRPSPASLAWAAAIYDPGLLLQLQATQRGQTITATTQHGRDGSDGQRRSCILAIASPCPAS